jgi:hypothetical protein
MRGILKTPPAPRSTEGEKRVTERESRICSAAREAVSASPRPLKDVAEFVNLYIIKHRLGNPMTESGVGAVIGKYGRATLKQFTREGAPWIESVASSN